MNKNNIFLQIAAISLLCASSTSFSMKKDSQLEDTKHLYKLFSLTKKDLEKTGFQKLSSDKKLMFSKGTDCQEKLFISSKDDAKKLEEVTSFKFNKGGNILFCNHGKIAEIINIKNNKSFKVGDVLTNDYSKYGFTYDNKYAFIVDTKISTLNIINFKTGVIAFSRKLDPEYNEKECEWILKVFTTQQYPLANLAFNLLGINNDKIYKYKPENKL